MGSRRIGKRRRRSPRPPAYALAQGRGCATPCGRPRTRAQVYQRACAGCHGPNGTGSEQNGSIRRAINVPAFLSLISNQALRRIIITGRPDLGMPTYAEKNGRPADFQPLTTAEIDDLVSLLAAWRTTSKVAQGEER